MIELIKKKTANLKDDALSGITVALALVPEAIAFAFIAGVAPVIGLYGAFLMGIVTSILGGRPGMISGATGAIAVVSIPVIQQAHLYAPEGMQNAGVNYLFATLLLMGVIQIVFGVFKLGKLVRLIPHPVMMGFVNGLAIVIFLGQMKMLQEPNGDWLATPQMLILLSLIGLTMAIMWLLPKLTKKIPAGLVGIVVVTLLVNLFGIDTESVLSFLRGNTGDANASMKAGLPSFQFQLFEYIDHFLTWETLYFIGPHALIMAAVGLIESLMTLQLVDELTETKGHSNRESIGQGIANIVNGLFGGMGGCAMIGQSVINVSSGGRGRASGIIAALGLLSFILFLSDYIELIPIAALVGVMFMVVIGTFAWSSFRVIPKIPRADALVIVLVSVITVVEDLAIAVISGVIVSALVFAWESAKRIRARKSIKEDGTKVYQIWGPLFFGSIQDFNEKFTVSEDPEKVEIDFIESKVQDHSGIQAIKNLVEKYEKAGKSIRLTHLSPECRNILIKSDKHLEQIIEEDINDPRYHVMVEVEG